MKSIKEELKDDSMVKPIDKSMDQDSATDRIEIEKIQLPEGLTQEEPDHNAVLFKNEPSFEYEKSMVQLAQDKFGPANPEPAAKVPPTDSPTRSENIIDKYKDRLGKQEVEPPKLNPVVEPETKEERRALRRQQTIKKRKLQREIDTLREDVDDWGDRLDRVASACRLILMLVITVLAAMLIFFLIRQFGNNNFTRWVILEICDQAVIVGLSFMTLRMLAISEPDMASVSGFRIWIYIALGLHGVLLIVGFVIMDYSGKMNPTEGSREDQSQAVYAIVGILYLLMAFGKGALFGYWVYLYRGYVPCYEKFYDKSMEDPTAAPQFAPGAGQAPTKNLGPMQVQIDEKEDAKPRSKAEDKTESRSSDKA